MNRPADFDRLARVYRWMELASFGPLLQRCRLRFLNEFSDCRTALVLGDGDGRFAAELLAAHSAIHVNAVDASPPMLDALLRRAGPHRDRVRTQLQLADVRCWSPERRSYDLIATHFLLDCLTTDEVASLAARLRACTTDKTRWVVSEFAVPQGRFGRIVARPLVASLYRAFGLLTGLAVRSLPDYRLALSQHGFTLRSCHPTAGGLLVSEVWVARPKRQGD